MHPITAAFQRLIVSSPLPPSASSPTIANTANEIKPDNSTTYNTPVPRDPLANISDFQVTEALLGRQPKPGKYIIQVPKGMHDPLKHFQIAKELDHHFVAATNYQ